MLYLQANAQLRTFHWTIPFARVHDQCVDSYRLKNGTVAYEWYDVMSFQTNLQAVDVAAMKKTKQNIFV